MPTLRLQESCLSMEVVWPQPAPLGYRLPARLAQLPRAGMAFVGIKLARFLDRGDHLVLYIYNIGAYLALVSILKVLYRVIILPISITFLFLALF